MMSRSLRSKTLPLLFSCNPKVNPCELWALPSQALFSTHIVGEKPVLVRDFIHSALYDPRHGYFAQRSRRSVVVLQKAIMFNQIEGM